MLRNKIMSYLLMLFIVKKILRSGQTEKFYYKQDYIHKIN
jgi:hypothetical protein